MVAAIVELTRSQSVMLAASVTVVFVPWAAVKARRSPSFALMTVLASGRCGARKGGRLPI